jgi:F-type H+-transporting ATPase subunit delta
MKGTRAALRYAKAVLNLAKEQRVIDKVNDDMNLIATALNENTDLKIMLRSPVIKPSVKRRVLDKIFKEKTQPLTWKLIELLIKNNRIDILEQFAKQYRIIYDFHKGIETALVTTAVPIDKKLENRIHDIVTKIIGKTITVKNVVDPSIVGGYILRVGDKQVDSSVVGLLNNVLETFGDNHYISKLNQDNK